MNGKVNGGRGNTYTLSVYLCMPCLVHTLSSSHSSTCTCPMYTLHYFSLTHTFTCLWIPCTHFTLCTPYSLNAPCISCYVNTGVHAPFCACPVLRTLIPFCRGGGQGSFTFYWPLQTLHLRSHMFSSKVQAALLGPQIGAGLVVVEEKGNTVFQWIL